MGQKELQKCQAQENFPKEPGSQRPGGPLLVSLPGLPPSAAHRCQSEWAQTSQPGLGALNLRGLEFVFSWEAGPTAFYGVLKVLVFGHQMSVTNSKTSVVLGKVQMNQEHTAAVFPAHPLSFEHHVTPETVRHGQWWWGTPMQDFSGRNPSMCF